MVECVCDADGCAYPVGLKVALEAMEYAELMDFLEPNM